MILPVVRSIVLLPTIQARPEARHRMTCVSWRDRSDRMRRCNRNAYGCGQSTKPGGSERLPPSYASVNRTCACAARDSDQSAGAIGRRQERQLDPRPLQPWIRGIEILKSHSDGNSVGTRPRVPPVIRLMSQGDPWEAPVHFRLRCETSLVAVGSAGIRSLGRPVPRSPIRRAVTKDCDESMLDNTRPSGERAMWSTYLCRHRKRHRCWHHCTSTCPRCPVHAPSCHRR